MARGLAALVRGHQSPSDPFSPLLDRYLMERPHGAPPVQPPKPHLRQGGRFTPSSMGKCMRAAIFQFMQVPGKRETSPEQELIFAVGDWTHYLLFSICLHMEEVLGPDVFSVVGIEQLVAVPSLYLAGWYDVHVRIHGRPYLMDVKTINDAGFTHLMHSGHPNPDHVKQLARYLRATGIKWGMLLYLNKNDQRFRVFMVRSSKKLWIQDIRWLRRGHYYLATREVPPMHEECSRGSRMAKNCPWQAMCYSGLTPLQLRRKTYGHKPSFEELWQETTGASL